jgi:hypothetical protein
MPLALFDAERWMIIVPDRNEVLSATSGSHVPTLVGQEHIIGGIRELDMWSPDVGWARHVSGSCSPALQASANAEASVAGRDCFVETRLLRTEDGGRNWTDLSLPQAALISTGDAAELNEAPGQPDNSIQSIGDRTQVFVGQGFDSCTLPSAGQMQNWITNSPYRVWNLYIGGSSRANCGTLTAAFISQLAQQGWKFIPTWVGPQAACSTIFGGTKMDYDPAIAFTQGVSEANAAVDTALTLGLTLADASGTIIYYDLESYDTNNAACRTAASSFISGWSGQVRARANQAGVYGAPCSSALSDFANISNVPDAIWAAYWTYASYNSNASVWNLPCLDNTLWSGSQRLRQYAGGHNETWGGVTLNIDSDVLGGIVSSTCPTITNWKAEYWNNTSLSGPVQLCRDDASLDFDWSLGPPAATIAANNFSARWTRTVSFPAGQYRFYLRHDDGARLFVDDVLRIDAWSTCCMWDQIDLTLTGGDHTLRVEMFEAGGAAYATLRWERLDITGWRGEYYNNTTLSNYPIVVRDDGANINFDWLGQSPDPVIQSDQFSARWTRSVTFTAGVYRFDVFHDDGARLYVDNSLVLQNWCSNCSLTDSAAVVLSAGSHAVRLEMWENSGFAGAQLSWQAVNLTLRFYFPLIVRTP